MSFLWVAAALLALSATSACNKDAKRDAGDTDEGVGAAAETAAGDTEVAADSPAGEAARQWYRAWFQGSPEVGEIPFFMQLPVAPLRGEVVVKQGDGLLRGEARWFGAEASANLPLLRTRLYLRSDAKGQLSGHMTSASPVSDHAESLPLRAEPVDEVDNRKRFRDVAACGAAPEAANGQGQGQDEPKAFAGEWLASFEERGEVGLSVVEREPGVWTGAAAFSNGTVVSLVGNAFGERLCLSGFDGVNPTLMVLDLQAGGRRLSGRWAAGVSEETQSEFTAERREQAIAHDTGGVRFTPNQTRLPLAKLGLAEFAGKPVIIEFGASWCPPCLDAVPLFRSIYEAHHGNGLEIVTLLFELEDDDELLLRKAEAFTREYEIPWPVMPVRGEIAPYWKVVPHEPEVTEVNLPVTLFVNADGTIRDAHMGFPPPNSGAPFDALRQRYEAAAKELVGGGRGE
ncbi:TlpA disulfide reductase family protein [Haliangium ochraceum]|uniref:Alkyl hydroperoxide reductase/ Thiol specific antioxidant/ Mal allergen n=1 Tax=Haliangium ochraceum (strain DSM 14365 / JCM 11303 / SMP-2) TaxID=502025 RepID=D0LQ49_HALO1|nr:TlpA disulfide reductase family protein [Haliangium ochraceum]ACY17086.1 alkyl hydroperoxide reductase/ Thiol specific antioxidant/ Mal allergen [Haliangium ochraceum DSM 14365]